jgi:hypothetical protein
MPDNRNKIKTGFSVLVLFTVMFCLSSCGHFRLGGFFGNRSLRKAFEWAKQDSARVADSLKRIAILNNPSTQVKQDSDVNLVTEKVSQTIPKGSYCIIVGSFSSSDNAQKRARDYFSKGYKTDIIESTNAAGVKIQLVSVRSFGDKAEAIIFLKKFQQDIDSSAWLYINN